MSHHITLGREVEPYRGFADVQKQVKLENLTVQVKAISLMESVRRGRNLIYRPLFETTTERQKFLLMETMYFFRYMLEKP